LHTNTIAAGDNWLVGDAELIDVDWANYERKHNIYLNFGTLTMVLVKIRTVE